MMGTLLIWETLLHQKVIYLTYFGYLRPILKIVLERSIIINIKLQNNKRASRNMKRFNIYIIKSYKRRLQKWRMKDFRINSDEFSSKNIISLETLSEYNC